jgi:hypothetical protein
MNNASWNIYSAVEEARRSRFEEGVPADPTQNMNPADAKKWKEENERNRDNFKSAASGTLYSRQYISLKAHPPKIDTIEGKFVLMTWSPWEAKYRPQNSWDNEKWTESVQLEAEREHKGRLKLFHTQVSRENEAVTDPSMLPKAFAELLVNGIKHVAPSGSKIKAISGQTSRTPGWDFTNLTVIEVTPKGSETITFNFTIHVAKGECSGLFTKEQGGKHIATVPVPRAGTPEKVVQMMVGEMTF